MSPRSIAGPLLAAAALSFAPAARAGDPPPDVAAADPARELSPAEQGQLQVLWEEALRAPDPAKSTALGDLLTAPGWCVPRALAALRDLTAPTATRAFAVRLLAAVRRMEPDQRRTFLAAAKDRATPVRLAFAREARTRDEPDLLTPLLELAADRDIDVRCAALRALGGFLHDPWAADRVRQSALELRPPLADAGGEPTPAGRVYDTLAVLLAELPTDSPARPVAHGMVLDLAAREIRGAWGVRKFQDLAVRWAGSDFLDQYRQALAAPETPPPVRDFLLGLVATIRHPGAVDLLIEALDAEEKARRPEVCRALKRLTGRDFPPDARAWSSWWDASRAAFAFPTPGRDP